MSLWVNYDCFEGSLKFVHSATLSCLRNIFEQIDLAGMLYLGGSEHLIILSPRQLPFADREDTIGLPLEGESRVSYVG